MNSVISNSAASAPPRADGGDLFDSASYSDFVRAAMRIRQARPDVSLLFESTIREPADQLLEVIREAFSTDVSSRYVSVFADGNHFAIEAVCKRYGLKPDQIIATTGVTSGMVVLFRALLSPGDRVLAERPGFDLIARLATAAGAIVQDLPRVAPGYGIDLVDLEVQLRTGVRLVVITNLHNPSGMRLSPDEIAAIGVVCDGAGTILVVDEVYADFAVATGAPSAAGLGPNIISASSLTKVFGLFALKFGWLAADAQLIARIRAVVPEGDFGVSKLSHAVAAHVLEAPTAFEAHWQAVLSVTRPIIEREIGELIRAGYLEGTLPEFGCMCFPRIPGVADTRAFARRLLAEHDLIVAPGEFFGAAGHIRIGYGSDARSMAVGLSRLREALSRR